MKRRRIWQGKTGPWVGQNQDKASGGFTLVELIFVILIVLIMAVIALPLMNNVSSYFKLRGAVSSATGAIQSTRYQAIFQGCPFQVVFTAATGNYQVTNSCPNTGVFTNFCQSGATSCPVPISGSGNKITLNADLTLTFSPGGRVTSAAFPNGGINMTLTYPGKTPEVITISSYGSINVTP